MQIRRLVRADAEAYRLVMLEAYERHVDAFTGSVAERGELPLSWWEQRLVERDDADEIVVGAWRGDRLVGVAGLRFEQRPRTRHKAGLYGMYVRDEVARQGIGERLIDTLKAEARRRGVRVVQLTVTDGNRAAERLYARCGFVAYGVEPLAFTTDDGYAAKVHLWIDLEVRSTRGDEVAHG